MRRLTARTLHAEPLIRNLHTRQRAKRGLICGVLTFVPSEMFA